MNFLNDAYEKKKYLYMDFVSMFFCSFMSWLESEIKECKVQLENTTETEEIHEDLNTKLKEIRKTLEQMIDFSGSKVDDDIIDKLVYQVIPAPNGKFKWILNLLDEDGNHIICGVNGRKNAPAFDGDLDDSLPLFQPCTGCYRF